MIKGAPVPIREMNQFWENSYSSGWKGVVEVLLWGLEGGEYGDGGMGGEALYMMRTLLFYVSMIIVYRVFRTH